MSPEPNMEGGSLLVLARLAILTVVFSMALLSPTEAQAQYSEVDAAIDSAGLPYVFHYIAWRESGDNPYAVNPYTGACGPFQFMPETAAAYGYTCYDLTDPYIAAEAAYALYLDYGLSPWSLTAY